MDPMTEEIIKRWHPRSGKAVSPIATQDIWYLIAKIEGLQKEVKALEKLVSFYED